MLLQSVRKYVALTALTIISVGCGGGGDGSSDGGSAQSGGVASNNGQSPGGYIYNSDSPISTTKIDLSTGKVVARFAYEFISPVIGGKYFGIKQDELPTFPTAKMLFLGQNGSTVTSSFDYTGKVLSYPKVSPDGRFVAFIGRPKYRIYYIWAGNF